MTDTANEHALRLCVLTLYCYRVGLLHDAQHASLTNTTDLPTIIRQESKNDASQ